MTHPSAESPTQAQPDDLDVIATKDIDEAWWVAIDHHDLNGLEALLNDAPANVLASTALLEAAMEEGCEPAVEMLLKAGAARPDLFPYALQQQDTSLLKVLLDEGEDPNRRDPQGCTPLHLVASRMTCFEDLGGELSAWMQQSQEDPDDEMTQIRIQKMQLLLDHGADINAVIALPEEGQTADAEQLAGDPARGLFDGATPADTALFTQSHCLHSALQKAGASHGEPRDPRLLFHLLEHPATPSGEHFKSLFAALDAPFSLRDPQGMTLLHAAISHDRTEQMQWLLDQGANPNERGEGPFTPLHLALFHLTQEQSDTTRLSILLDGGADPMTAPPGQQPPLLHLLTLAAEIETPLLLNACSALFRAGATVGNAEGDINPLCLAAIHGTLPWELFALLMEHGAGIDTPYAGQTALHYLMLQYLDDPDDRAQRRRTAEGLIHAGADINALSTQPLNIAEGTLPPGASPTDLAAIAEDQELLAWLQEAGGQFALLKDHFGDATEGAEPA